MRRPPAAQWLCRDQAPPAEAETPATAAVPDEAAAADASPEAGPPRPA